MNGHDQRVLLARLVADRAHPQVDGLPKGTGRGYADRVGALRVGGNGEHQLAEKDVGELDRLPGVTDHLRIRDDIQKRIGAPLYGTAFLEEPLEVSTSTFKWVESSDPFSYVGPHWTDLIYSYYKSKPAALTAVGQKKRLVRDGINAYDAVQVRVDGLFTALGL